jgi:hypothetical protein
MATTEHRKRAMTEQEKEAERRWVEDERTEAACALMDGPEADAFIKALDVLGWKLVCKDPEQATHVRWMLNHRYENFPEWCENGYQPVDVEKHFGREAAETVVWRGW